MSEEKTPEEIPYETFAERVQKVRGEAKAKKENPASQNFQMSERNKEMAQAFLRLSENSDFKKYLEFENLEIADLCTNPYGNPRDRTMDAASFSEKMAFNKGCLFQMNYIRQGRDWLMKTYLEQTRKEQKKGGQNG